MKWFINMKIGSKLILGFLIVAVIAGMVGVVGIVNIQSIAASGDALYTDNTLGLEYVGESATSYQRIRFNSLKMILDSANSAEYIKKTDRYERDGR